MLEIAKIPQSGDVDRNFIRDKKHGTPLNSYFIFVISIEVPFNKSANLNRHSNIAVWLIEISNGQWKFVYKSTLIYLSFKIV